MKKRAKIYNDGAFLIRKRTAQSAIRTGLKFSLLGGTFAIVNYQVVKYREKTDPLNFGAGGLAMGALGGLLQGMNDLNL